MTEPGNLRGTVARHWVGLLLLVAMASHANDDAVGNLRLEGTVVDAATGLPVAGADVHVRLGPYSISSRLAPHFRNHFVQARPLSADGEPEIHRVFVDGSGRYRFDGLEQGDYLVSHSSPYYTGAREVSLFAASVEGVDFEPTYDQGLAVPVLDAESQEPIESATCDINEGPWAGESLHQNRRQKLRFPTNLTHTDMTCVSEGYEPVPVRWDGGPVSLELTPTGTG